MLVNTQFIIICIIFAACAMVSIIRQLQMLQQNSYFPTRYLKWLYNSYFYQSVIFTAAFCAISVLCRLNKPVAVLIIAAAVLAAQLFFGIKNYKSSIKKIVFTKRVLRLIIAAAVIIAALVIVCIKSTGALHGITFVALIICGLWSPALVLLAWFITWPVEKICSKYYISDAVKILDSCGNLCVIGVTGSYGKTGTKFILSRILSEHFNVVTTPGSYNTTMGVVKTVREMLRPETQIFICEMGAKNRGDIKEICDIVRPNIGIITSVGPQHLDTFKTVDNVFLTKFELYTACKRNNGEVFVNIDSKALAERLGEKDCRTYGLTGGESRAVNIEYGPFGARFTVCTGNTEIPLTTKLLGKHNVANITGAVGIAYMLGVTTEEIRYAVSRLEPTEHRLQMKPWFNGCTMIDDAYNANPEGCIEAVQLLASFTNKTKIIITPGLVELGDKEYDFNYKLGLAAAKICDIIVLVGKNRAKPLADAIATTEFNADNMKIVSSFAEASDFIKQIADENSVVLIENDLPDNYLN